jgi:hypothetical protein
MDTLLGDDDEAACCGALLKHLIGGFEDFWMTWSRD